MAIGKTPNRELMPFLRRFGDDFEGYKVRGTCLVKLPICHLLAAFLFEPLTGDKDFRWLSLFVQPLYIPSPHLGIDFGERLGQHERNPEIGQLVRIYGDESEVAQTQKSMTSYGLPKLERISSMEGFYSYLVSWESKGRTPDYFTYEALAYTAIYLNKLDEAQQHVQDALMSVSIYNVPRPEYPDGLAPSQKELLERVKNVWELQETKGREAVLQQFMEWERYTVKHLKIEDLWQESPDVWHER